MSVRLSAFLRIKLYLSAHKTKHIPPLNCIHMCTYLCVQTDNKQIDKQASVQMDGCMRVYIHPPIQADVGNKAQQTPRGTDKQYQQIHTYTSIFTHVYVYIYMYILYMYVHIPTQRLKPVLFSHTPNCPSNRFPVCCSMHLHLSIYLFSLCWLSGWDWHSMSVFPSVARLLLWWT